MVCLRKPLTLGDGSLWEFRYSCRSTTRIFGQLVISDFLANERLVFPVLGIDRATREMKANETETSGITKRSRIKKLRWITSLGHRHWRRPSERGDFYASQRFLLRALGVDKTARELEYNETESSANRKRLRIKDTRSINKGLAMELLVGALLTCLDSPKEIRSWCDVSEPGVTKSFAPGPNEDILATYQDFCIVAEVSARRKPDVAFFRGQLKQAILHADAAIDRGIKGTVYALVVTGCPFESNLHMRKPYRQTLAKREELIRERRERATDRTTREHPDSDPGLGIRLIPLKSHDLYEVANAILNRDSEAGLQVSSEVLAEALETIYRRLVSGNTPTDKPWMADTLKRALVANEPARDRLPIGAVDA